MGNLYDLIASLTSPKSVKGETVDGEMCVKLRLITLTRNFLVPLLQIFRPVIQLRSDSLVTYSASAHCLQDTTNLM